MVKVRDILELLINFAPIDMKMDFDNPGFLVGRSDAAVSRVLISLDITDDAISEARELGAELIVSHHPLFFSLKSVTDRDPAGRKIIGLVSNGISAICMHTNLDAACGGVNDALAATVGIVKPELLDVEGVNSAGYEYSYGRFGFIAEPVPLSEYLVIVKSALDSCGLRYHDAGRPVHKVAVIGGSGGSMLSIAHTRGCDTFITSDIKYDVFLEAKELGINLIDGDHFCTENVIAPVLDKIISEKYPELNVRIAKCHGQTAEFM